MGILQEGDNQSLDRRLLGEHRLAGEIIPPPPEREAIAVLQTKRTYTNFEAVEEAISLELLRPRIRHAELSPTFRCPEDCGGCSDRVSLHIGDPPEKQISLSQWLLVIDRLQKLGVEYFLLIGGTIDAHQYTPEMMRYILDKPPPVDVGWFSDGIMLFDWKTGTLNRRFYRLVDEGGMLGTTTHISADYLVPEGVQPEGPILSPHHRWDNEFGGSRYYKSAFGERLARRLVEAGARRVVLNTAISAQNLDEVIPIYQYVGELQDYARQIGSETKILYAFSPWVWRPHLARGDDPRNYDVAVLLKEEHRPQLQAISDYFLQDTWRRLDQGLPRVAGNSSGFLAGLPDFAITQDVPYPYGSGELAVTPDGTVRMDPVFVSARMLQAARNPYGYRDRDRDYNPFDRYNEGLSGPGFPNLIQTTWVDIAWR